MEDETNQTTQQSTNVDFRDSVDTVCRIRFPPEADSKKQGKLGLDVGAPREA